MSVLDAIRAARELGRRSAIRPAHGTAWLPNQHAFLTSEARFRQIRQGNQWGGKTWAALSEVVGRCIGVHPVEGYHYPPPREGYEAWIICATWQQSLAIQAKLHAVIPAGVLHESVRYDPVLGFRGKNPAVRFKSGAIVRIKTTNQGGIALAGATLDLALFDEPPTSVRTLSEVIARLTHRKGTLLLSYTPVNAPETTEYLQTMVADGKIEDHWSALTVDALIPVGHTEPLLGRDQAWIDALKAQYPAHEVPVVIDGEWEMRSAGAYFGAVWDPARMIYAGTPKEDRLYLGIDHGDRPGKQIALLVAVTFATREDDAPSVYVLDEYVDTTGSATPSEDAAGILAMLARNGAEWSRDLDAANGDRVHMPGTGAQKSNRDLAVHIAKRLKVNREALRPEIRTVKRGEAGKKGGPMYGERYIYQAMARGKFGVHPRCARLIEAIPRYTGASHDTDAKDPIDALRYALDPEIFGRRRQAMTQQIRIRN